MRAELEAFVAREEPATPVVAKAAQRHGRIRGRVDRGHRRRHCCGLRVPASAGGHRQGVGAVLQRSGLRARCKVRGDDDCQRRRRGEQRHHPGRARHLRLAVAGRCVFAPAHLAAGPGRGCHATRCPPSSAARCQAAWPPSFLVRQTPATSWASHRSHHPPSARLLHLPLRHLRHASPAAGAATAGPSGSSP